MSDKAYAVTLTVELDYARVWASSEAEAIAWVKEEWSDWTTMTFVNAEAIDDTE